MSPVSAVFHAIETVRIALKGKNSRETGEIFPDRNAEPYPHKRMAETGMLGSCS